MNRINIEYFITKDYSGLNSPKFVNALKIRNLILLPLIENQPYNLSVSDEITLLNHTTSTNIKQKIVLDCGTIQLYDNNTYQYFYIANGIYDSDHEYSLVINNETIKLSKKINPTYNAKLLIGSLILEDNYNYIFDQNIPILVHVNHNTFKCNISRIFNKYNYYSPLKTNTILLLLDSNNTEILYQLNHNYTNILTRPLYYKNFPLGSIRLSITNYDGVLINESLAFKLFLNDKSFFIDGNSIYISNLTGGSYSIKIIDREGPLHIFTINNNLVDQDNFSFVIDKPQDIYTSDQILSQPRDFIEPKQGLANLMINLIYDDPVEVLGPNNVHTILNNGYQTLYNILPGLYTIKQKDKSKSFQIYPNQNTIISLI